MTPAIFRQRTRKFAVDIIIFAKKLPSNPIDRMIANQLARAAASTALEILVESGVCQRVGVTRLLRETEELTRMLVRSRETARRNAKSRSAPIRPITNH